MLPTNCTRKSPRAGVTQGQTTNGYDSTFCNKKISKRATTVKRFDKELVRQSLTMRDLLAHYGLEADNKDALPCPFHHETKASATIRNNYFYCYGCGAKADVFGFVQRMEGCSFPRSIEVVAVLAGVTQSSSADVAESIKHRKQQQAEKERIRLISEHKYRLLARIARVSRELSPSYMGKLDHLLNEWLHDVPAWADLRPLEFAFKRGSVQNVGHAIDRLFNELEVCSA